MLDLRQLIEGACVEIVAANDSRAPLEQFREALDAMKANRDNPLEFGRRDLAFHRVIVESAGNQLYLAVIDGCFQSLGQNFARETYSARSTRIPEILAEHAEVLEAIRLHNPTMAKKALQFHLQHSRQRLETLAANE